ncbi:MAG: hypothetical protein IT440_12815 [Phycisphaeraceae bacterium]|nr:hypothetical protein [Phycisphaeraceae bacterium]
MSIRNSIQGLLLALVVCGGYSAQAAEPVAAPPMTTVQPGVVMADDVAGLVRLYSNQTGLAIERDSGKLLGIWSAAGLQLVDNTLKLGVPWMPLWSAQVNVKGAEKPVAVDGSAGKPTCKLENAADGAKSIVMTWTEVPAGGATIHATMRVTLKPGDTRFVWSMDVQPNRSDDGIWSVTYPQLATLASDPQPKSNWIVIPYRRGTIRIFGKEQPRYDSMLPYPGPAAKFQFMATYGLTTRQGVYFATPDEQACDKVFIQKNYPDRNAMLLAVEHHPDGRASEGAAWHATYDTLAGAYDGHWYDACRLYRNWWARTVWASKGLLQDRSDIPDWIKNAAVVTRTSTTHPARTVENNLKGSLALLEALDRRPFFGIWYGVFENATGKGGLEFEGMGVIRPLKPGIEQAIGQLKEQGVHHMAYIQSIIYDPNTGDEADAAVATRNVGRERDGKPTLYGPPKYAMCRATEWWQQRIADLCANVVRDGFDGAYLDSFGKGAAECFDPTHGHSLGGGNTVITGQRRMAQRALDAMRKINPQAILSGEAPVEAFRDLLHVNLYAKNTWDGYVPCFRAIWGDYSLGFGRNVRSAKDGPGNIISEMAVLFVEGAVIGRIFVDGGSAEVLQPQHKQALDYLRLISDYSVAGIDHLRFGDYLRPLDLGDMPQVTFTESVENGKVVSPAVMHSVTRSHRDGSVAIVLANVGDQPVTVQVPIDPGLRQGGTAEAVLEQMDRGGKRTRLAGGVTPWRQAVVVQPRDVVFLVLR